MLPGSGASPRLSVIIPCLNMGATIGAQLEALARQSWPEPWEVIVSDNGSRDDSVRIVEGFGARLPLRLVDSSDRPGPSHARNVGARHATAPALAFCDADDEVGVNWLAAMHAALTEHDFVGCRLDLRKLNDASVQHPQEYALQYLWYPPYLPVAGSCGLGIKRSVHEDVGGFDESLPRSQDTDYCIRVQLRGIPLVFANDAVVHYRTRKGFGMTFGQARGWAFYHVLMYKRYRGDMRVSDPWARYLDSWPRLVKRFAGVRSGADLHEALGKLGWQLGLLEGSVKFRTTPVP